MSNISYKFTAPGTEEYAKLQKFAETFAHTITPHPNINTYAHYNGETCFGYSDHVFLPTVYPAFHPGLTRPRDVIQVMSDWRAHMQLSGKVANLGVPMPEDTHRMFFPEEIMNKLGLVRLNRELYAVK